MSSWPTHEGGVRVAVIFQPGVGAVKPLSQFQSRGMSGRLSVPLFYDQRGVLQVGGTPLGAGAGTVNREGFGGSQYDEIIEIVVDIRDADMA